MPCRRTHYFFGNIRTRLSISNIRSRIRISQNGSHLYAESYSEMSGPKARWKAYFVLFFFFFLHSVCVSIKPRVVYDGICGTSRHNIILQYTFCSRQTIRRESRFSRSESKKPLYHINNIIFKVGHKIRVKSNECVETTPNSFITTSPDSGDGARSIFMSSERCI